MTSRKTALNLVWISLLVGVSCLMFGMGWRAWGSGFAVGMSLGYALEKLSPRA